MISICSASRFLSCSHPPDYPHKLNLIETCAEVPSKTVVAAAAAAAAATGMCFSTVKLTKQLQRKFMILFSLFVWSLQRKIWS